MAVDKLKVLVPVALVAVNFAFAGWHVLGKRALNNGVNPLVFALYREISATVLMFMFAFAFDGIQKFSTVHFWRIALLGILCAANVLGFILALKLVSPTNAAVMQLLVPVLVQIFSIAAKHEVLSLLKLVGMSFSICGAAVITILPSTHSADNDTAPSANDGLITPQPHSVLLGNLLLLLQCFAVAVSVHTQKELLCTYPPTSVTAWYYSIATVISMAVVGATRPPAVDFRISDAAVWEALVYAVIFASAFTYITTTWALSHAPASLVATFSTLQPLATALLSMIVLDYHLTWVEVLGGCLLTAGLLITVHAGRNTQAVPSPAEQRKKVAVVGEREGESLLYLGRDDAEA